MPNLSHTFSTLGMDRFNHSNAIRDLQMIYLTLKHTLQPFSGIPTLNWCRLYVIFGSIGHHIKVLHKTIPSYSSIAKRVDFQSDVLAGEFSKVSPDQAIKQSISKNKKVEVIQRNPYRTEIILRIIKLMSNVKVF